MATLPKEQVTQRDTKATVSITPGTAEDAGHVQWLSTTTLPYTVVNTTSVGASYDTPAEIETARTAYEATLNAEQDLHADFGIGLGYNALTVVGDGTETLSAANNATTTKDMSAYVSGGVEPYYYFIDDSSVVDLAGASASMAGKYLEYVSGATDGTDVVVVGITDAAGDTVTVEVTVTVA